MKKNKCSRCGLINLASDAFCRRCGEEIGRKSMQSYPSRSPREAAKRSSSFYTLLAVLLIGAPVAYFYFGVERSLNDIKGTGTNRIATQPKQPTEGLSSRSEQDQKRAGKYGTALQNSQDLATSQKHNEDIKKLIQPEPSNTRK